MATDAPSRTSTIPYHHRLGPAYKPILLRQTALSHMTPHPRAKRPHVAAIINAPAPVAVAEVDVLILVARGAILQEDAHGAF